jgi:hypothetical protein
MDDPKGGGRSGDGGAAAREPGSAINSFGQRAAGDPRSATAFNVGPSSIGPMHADSGWADRRWYDFPREDPAWPEVHTYTDAMSYAPGETVSFHSSTHARDWTLEVVLDGLKPQRVLHREGLPGVFHAAPKDAYREGCRWPESLRWTIPEDARSGFYKVISSCARPDGGRFVQHHFFVVRPTERTRSSDLLMILPTSTWMAYNDWSGANHYIGVDGPDGNQASPVLHLQRPWTRGMVWLPEGAPRICTEPTPDPLTQPRYPTKDWAWSHGFGYFHAASGWAQYDRHFKVWADREGIALDMITQTDLHYRPEILERYRAVVIVGHDEYWSHDMRRHMEAWIEAGGRLARFGGNFLWQVRLEDDGLRQVCYKGRAATEDPVRDTDRRHLLTTAWEDLLVNWPGATTVGVNGFRGMYAGWGGFAPRGSKGLTVYRPDHWVFEGTQLGYGDVFGHEARIFSYEVDGVDYTFRRGLPYPTHADGTPAEVRILAMTPAMFSEAIQPGEGFRYYLGDADHRLKSLCVYGTDSSEAMDEGRYGAGMLVHMPKGRGEVVTAGTCEWVMGLKRNDFFTCTITRNVLGRFTAA